jgi:hypothetical protein
MTCLTQASTEICHRSVASQITLVRAFFLLNRLVMQGMHSATKGEREVVRQLVHSVLIRDMSTFNPERFKEWIKGMDLNFRKVGLTLTFKIHDRVVHFAVKEIRSRRTIFQFQASTSVAFDDSSVIMSVEEFVAR